MDRQNKSTPVLYRLQAGALQMTILVSFIVMLISGFFIFSYYLNGQLIDNRIIRAKLTDGVSSALYTLFDSGSLPLAEGEQSVQLLLADSLSVQVTVRNWGAYRVALAQSRMQSEYVSRAVLAGADIVRPHCPAMYLANNNLYLTVCGNNTIVGDCYLPKSGVALGQFAGEGFRGTDAVSGRIFTSDARLPEPDVDIIRSIKLLADATFPSGASVVSADILDSSVISRSFADTLIVVAAVGSLHISNQFIAGNIIISSDTLVEISSSAQLSDIIIVAPYIRIQSGFRGSAQFVASRQIIIEEDCRLDMPSSLILMQKGQSGKQSAIDQIHIMPGSSVAGIIMLQSAQGSTSTARIIIDKTATVLGQVYSNASVEHIGTIYGSLYSSRLYRAFGPSVYENLLSNSVTDISMLPREFLGIALAGDTVPFDIIKDLH